jgi:ABC-type transporter Mla subunit MlaD
VDRRTKRALVELKLTGGPYEALREDVFCETRPQSTIGEYFIDCQPGNGRKLKQGSRIPVERTASTIPTDVVQNTLRLPYRQRLRIIINELGGGVAGRERDLNDAIRRGVPALRETDRVLSILAAQNRVIADLTTNADTVITALADNRRDVSRWVRESRDAAAASAERDADIAGTFRRLPTFLEELRPTMAALGRVADEQTPALQDLNAVSGQLKRFFDLLGPFSNASRPAVRSLGEASVTGSQAVRAARPVVSRLRTFARQTPEVGKNLSIILRDLDDPGRRVETDPRAAEAAGVSGNRGYSGLEALLAYVFDQEQTTNIFDRNGYMLKASVFESHCAPYRNAETVTSDRPVSSEPGAPTGRQLFEECKSVLGPTQPGITSPDVTPAGAIGRTAQQRAQQDSQIVTAGANAAAPPGGAQRPQQQGGAPAPSGSPAPIDVGRTIQGLLGGRLPGVPTPPQTPSSPAPQQSAEMLLDYLLAP